MSENNNTKLLGWIARQHPDCELLIGDMAELQGHSVKNRLTPEASPVLVPSFWGLSTGFPCVSRTPQSSQTKQNKDCIQEERSTSGEAYKLVRETYKKHDVTMLDLENVIGLAQKSEKHALCDADWMLEKMIEDGFSWSLRQTVEKMDFGGFDPRERIYWLGLKHLRQSARKRDIDAFFLKVLYAMKLPGQAFRSADLIIMGHHERRAACETAGFVCLMDTGMRIPKRTKGDPEYKLIHMELFQKFGLEESWPVTDRPRLGAVGVLGSKVGSL